MPDVAKRMYGPAQPGTGNSTVYTAPSGGAVVRNIHVINTTGSAATFSLAINGTAATQANCYYYQETVDPNGTLDWSGFLALGNADTIQMLQGTASALTVTISGIEL